jgi:hypothetical protein
MRRGPFLAVSGLAALWAAVALAAFEVNVTAPPGFADGVKRIAVVTVLCHEMLNCPQIEQTVVAKLAQMNLGITAVSGTEVRRVLFAKGETAYRTELREQLAADLQLDALMELEIPYGKRGEGYGGRRGSEVKVDLRLVRPTGAILMHGTGTGRPKNVVSSPERVAGNVVEKILERAFGTP